MIYKLNNKEESMTMRQALSGIGVFVKPDIKMIFVALVSIVINAAANILAPFLLGQAVDVAIIARDYDKLVIYAILLIVTYIVTSVTNYTNIIVMGRVGHRVLFRLRQNLFGKIQSLPIAFFNQNKTGDLVSRITNDTNTVNQLFSEVLVRLTNSVFTLIGIGAFIIYLHPKLGLATVSVAIGLFIVTRLSNSLLQRLNKASLDTVGEFSADVQEHIHNMKAVIAFRRREFFVSTLDAQNDYVMRATRKAGIANGIISPLYRFAGQISQVVILIYGLSLLSQGSITIGLLISYFAYANKFFEPLRIIASLWGTVQKAIAGWKRIISVLKLKSDMPVIQRDVPKKHKSDEQHQHTDPVMDFDDVSFGYEADKLILHKVNLSINRGDTLAIVGPTGGGKSTTASLMMRMYDSTSGAIRLHGQDIRSYQPEDISKCVSFILQEPVLFTGTVGQNLVLGNEKFKDKYDESLLQAELEKFNISEILDKFPEGLATKINPDTSSISLGQQQLIAFIRAVLRKPELLILDEATANVDTVTEQQLNHILEQIQDEIAVVIIAHRLNTIRSADQIIFIQNGRAQKAQSFDDAIKKIEKAQASS